MTINYSIDQLKTGAAAAAQSYGIDPKVFQSLIQQESSWDPSPKTGNGGGLGQLTRAAVKDVGGDYDKAVSDPAYNLTISAAYLAKMIKSSGNLYDGLRGYRAGLGNLSNPEWMPITNKYATTILNRAGYPIDKAKSGTGGVWSPTTVGNSDSNESYSTGAGGLVGMFAGGGGFSQYLISISVVLIGSLLILAGVWFIANSEMQADIRNAIT